MRYVVGNLLECEEIVIAHGCNCQGVMGSGVALAIRRKWPDIYEDYRKIFEDDLYDPKLGDCISDVTEDGTKVILNLLTQESFGTDRRHVNYAAIVSSLVAYIDDIREDIDSVTIAIPKIGAGLGGGDWNVIELLLTDLEAIYTDIELEFVVYVLDESELPNTSDRCHPSHVLRSSDASSFDYVCVNCGETDQVPGGWGNLKFVCKGK